MFAEHIFTYSRVSRDVKHKYHVAKTNEKLDLEAEEIIDEMLDWDGTELWARYPDTKPAGSAYNNFCEYVKHRYPDAIVNPNKEIIACFNDYQKTKKKKGFDVHEKATISN